MVIVEQWETEWHQRDYTLFIWQYWQDNSVTKTKSIVLVVCLSTNGERATLLLNLILTTNTQAIKIKSSF